MQTTSAPRIVTTASGMPYNHMLVTMLLVVLGLLGGMWIMKQSYPTAGVGGGLALDQETKDALIRGANSLEMLAQDVAIISQASVEEGATTKRMHQTLESMAEVFAKANAIANGDVLIETTEEPEKE